LCEFFSCSASKKSTQWKYSKWKNQGREYKRNRKVFIEGRNEDSSKKKKCPSGRKKKTTLMHLAKTIGKKSKRATKRGPPE